MNSLHPCTLPQRALFAAVRRVSPLCAVFCPVCECVRDSTAKAHVAPTCGQRRKMRIQYADPTQRSPAAAGKILPFGRSQHRIWLVAGAPAPCQMLFAGRSPHPLLRHKVRCACNALRERAFHAPLPCSSVPNKTRFAGLLFGRGKRKIRRKICEKISNSAFGSQNRIWKQYAERRCKRT